jgi:hypothetical protein
MQFHVLALQQRQLGSKSSSKGGTSTSGKGQSDNLPPLSDYISDHPGDSVNGCYMVNIGDGKMCCEVAQWYDELFSGLDWNSRRGFDKTLGFPPSSNCFFYGQISCEDLADAEFLDGDFEGHKVFPQGSPSGFRINGSLEENDMIEAEFELMDGIQWDIETEILGDVDEDKVPNSKISVMDGWSKGWSMKSLREYPFVHSVLQDAVGATVSITANMEYPLQVSESFFVF